MPALKTLAFLTGLTGFILGGCAGAFGQPAAPHGDGFLSRFTVAVPFFTRHFPRGEQFNDHNWGGFVFLAMDDRWSLVAGDFINSYDRNTALGGISYLPVGIDLSRVRIDMGGIVGLDINRGYRGHDNLDPALAAASIKISGGNTGIEFLDHAGLLVTIIPGFAPKSSTALNLALTLRL